MMKNSKSLLALCCLILFAGVSVAQTPGDGIPDIYHFEVEATIPVSTSLDGTNTITRPAGSIVVDTDGTDMVALLIGSSTDWSSAPAGPGGTGCELCNNGFLPDPNAPPFFVSSWTAGYINGSNQLVRTSPLDTLGFVGVTGEYDDPGAIFPAAAIGYAPAGTTFDGIFDGGAQVTFATADSGTIFTNVTPVPEPASLGLFGLALVGLIGLRSR